MMKRPSNLSDEPISAASTTASPSRRGDGGGIIVAAQNGVERLAQPHAAAAGIEFVEGERHDGIVAALGAVEPQRGHQVSVMVVASVVIVRCFQLAGPQWFCPTNPANFSRTDCDDSWATRK